MSVVLVLEPDGAQAEQLLRVLRKRVRAEAILVKSTAAAIEVIDNQTPDLILLTALLSPRDEDRLMGHLRSLEGAAHLQTLTIPQLAVAGDDSEEPQRTALGRFRKKKPAAAARAGCDPDVFAQEISSHLAHALEMKSRPVIRSKRHRAAQPAPEVVVQAVAPPVEEAPAPEFVPEPMYLEPEPQFEPFVAEPDPVVEDTSASVFSSDAEPVFASGSDSVFDAVPAPAPSYFQETAEPEAPPAVAAETIEHDDPLERLARRFGFGSGMFRPAPETAPPPPEPEEPAFVPDNSAALLAAEAAADARLAAETAARLAEEAEARRAAEARLAEEAEARLAAEAEARLAAEARQAAETEARLAAEREARLAAEVERVRAEAEARRVAELARLKEEAESVRDAAIAEAKAAAEREARETLAAEREARLAAEVERVRAEAEAQRVAELARLKEEAESVRDAAIAEAKAAAEREARETLASELTRVRSEVEGVYAADLARVKAEEAAAVEAETRLAEELERVRAEGEARRLSELARLQAEADFARDAAITEARTAAEREAREALASELTRVRSEAEGVFAADLARVRAEVEAKLSAQSREAERRLAQSEEARSAAEAAAAAALGAEVARVRGETEARLQHELERIRAEAEAARIEELSVTKHATRKIREAAAREAAEARANAEAAAQRTLEAEMARVRAQADKFLQTEIARVRADAQERQAAELEELRAQMAEIRDTAAKTAAAESADYYKIWQAEPDTAGMPASGAVAPDTADADDDEDKSGEEDSTPPMEMVAALAARHLPWVKWALPAAGCMLLVANIGSSAKRPVTPAHAVVPVEKPFVEVRTTGALKVTSTPAGARLLVDGRSYGETPLTIPALEPGAHTLVLRTSTGSVTRRVTIRAGQTTVASEAIFSGWVAIYSAIPMTISLNGKVTAPGSDGRIMTAPGSYEVTLVNEQFNYHGSKTLEVRPGEVTAYTVPLPTAAVRFIAPEGADISVDGAAAGKAPMADSALPLGTHEISATLPDLSQRSVTVAVRYGETTEARLER